MDVTYNINRQNMAGNYFKNAPIADEYTPPPIQPEYPHTYAEQNTSAHGHHHTYAERDVSEHSHHHWSSLPIPYPPVEVRCPNPAYAALLQKAYAGHVSEFTAIAQYFYHHIQLKGCYPDVAEALEEIAIQEMHHLELLAECIVKLGGDPVLAVSTRKGVQWWRGNMADCSKQFSLMLLKDIQGEYAAIADYRSIISCIDDECVIALLERIILDEEEHIRRLSAMLEHHWGDKKADYNKK